MLEVKNITKTFGDVIACEHMSFNVDEEIVVLLGPSGCGKTTTLRCIAGLEEPDEGDVLIQEDSIIKYSPQDRSIGMVFQDIALFPHLTVRENMRFGLDRQDIKKDRADQEVQEMAERLHIADLLDRNPSALSGGQRQRAAIGRALVVDPAIFLLDEPFASLDANLKVELRTTLKRLQRDFMTPMVHVTHDQEEAMVLGDKTLIMSDGHLMQEGSPTDIFKYPANLFTAQFIGAPNINLFEVEVSEEGERIKLTHDLFSLNLDRGTFSSSNIPNSAVMGIRPQNISLLEPETSESPTISGGQVVVVEPRGGDEIVFISFRAKEVRVIVDDISKFNKDSIDIVFNDNILLFDKENGARIS